MSATPDITPRPKRQRLDSLKNPQPRPLPGARKTQHDQAAQAPPRTCTNPGCHSTNVGEEDGSIICHECGTVLSDANIVSEVQFVETGNGGHIAMGAYVAHDQAHASTDGMMGLKTAGWDNRRVAEANGKRYITQIGTALNIPQTVLDSGMNTYKLASNFNFIQGRTSRSVAAVCLYIACRLRRDDNRHMLIDFADVLMLNVFKLGHIYKGLLEELHINDHGYNIPPIVPESLVWRFASRLEFGERETAVANDAVRIVQRMERDWMTHGRRPAGICGAALIVAAGMNNFRRTVREMVYVAKVTELTLMKRLEEFTRTGSAALTVEEFRRIDLEREEDPPAFEADQRKKKRGRKRKVLELDDDGDADPEPQPTPVTSSSVDNHQLETPSNTQDQAQTDAQIMPPPPLPIDPQLLPSTIDPEHISSEPSSTNPEPPTKRPRGRPPNSKANSKGKGKALSSPTATQAVEPSIISGLLVPNSLSDASTLTTALNSAPDPDDPLPTPTTRLPIADTELISDSEFAPDDAEIHNCKLTPAEYEIKKRIWTHENRDWLRAHAAKELKQQLARENGTAPKVKTRIRRRTRMGDMRAYRRGEGLDVDDDDDNDEGMPATGAGDAVGKMLKKRGYSRKINYEAVHKVYEPSPGASSRAASERREVGAGSPGAGDLLAGSPSPSPGPMSPAGSLTGAGAGAGAGGGSLSMLSRSARTRRPSSSTSRTPKPAPTKPQPAPPVAAAPAEEAGGAAEGEEEEEDHTPLIPEIDTTPTRPEDERESDADSADFFSDADGEDDEEPEGIEEIVRAMGVRDEEEDGEEEEW